MQAREAAASHTIGKGRLEMRWSHSRSSWANCGCFAYTQEQAKISGVCTFPIESCSRGRLSRALFTVDDMRYMMELGISQGHMSFGGMGFPGGATLMCFVRRLWRCAGPLKYGVRLAS